MATHSYNVEIATDFGIEESILIYHFSHWIGDHAANGTNLHDGRFWSYDKTEGLYAILPEFRNKKKIEYFINKLVEKDILMKGNFNNIKFDRTLWYTFTDNGLRLIFEHRLLTNDCIKRIIEEVSKVSDFDFSKFGYGKPDSEITITHNIHPYKESTHFVRTEEKQTSSKDWDLTFIRADYTSCVMEWLTHKKKIKKGYKTESGVKKMYENLVRLSGGNPDIAQMIVDQSIANNWDGLFALKGGGPTQSRMQQQMQDIHDRAKLSLNLLMEKEKERQNGRGNNSVGDFESIF